MSFVGILIALTSILVPSLPLTHQQAYVSNNQVRADRAVTPANNAPVPIKQDIESLGPRLSAQSAIVVDAESGVVLFEKNARIGWPMASITKLMTALLVLDENLNLEVLLEMTEADDREGAEDFIRPGQSAKVRDFLIASLLGSANNATITLARSVNADMDMFVQTMNARARALGMSNTVFIEPSGLDAGNTSTAYDIVKLLKETGNRDAITAITGTHQDTITVLPRGTVKQVFTTNHLMGSIVLVEHGKTGHLDESLFNLATAVTTPIGRTLYIVTLGSETNENRVQDAKSLAVWAARTYLWE